MLCRDRFQQRVEDLRSNVARHQVAEQTLRRLIEDVVHLGGAELLCLGLERRFALIGDGNAGGTSRMGRGIALFFAHNLGYCNLVRTELADGQ